MGGEAEISVIAVFDGAYKAVSLDDKSFVSLLYRAIMGRDPDPAGYALHLARLRNGEATHDQLALDFVRSDESKTWIAKFQGYSEQDLYVFNMFETSSVKPRKGFLTDFIGSRTRISSLWKGCEPFDNTVFPLPIPGDYHADAIEWIGTLKGVLAAKDSFSVMELGAGHGPWIVASAKAAELRGINTITLCAVEADPGRFALMRQNVEDNELASYDVTLLQAAVGIANGRAHWPRLADPVNDSGARPLRCRTADGRDHEADAAYLAGRLDETIDVEVVSFENLLALQPRWDLVHVDIQGTEVEICRAFLNELSARVRYLVIGTHSRKIDGDLLELFVSVGWDLEHEKPAGFMFRRGEAVLERMTTQDGTQVWRNPRL